MFKKEIVKAVGFDLDECLYPSSPKINDRIRNQIAAKILEMRCKLKDMMGARDYFEKRYNELGSGRKVLIEAGYSAEESGKIIDIAVSQADINDVIKEDPETAQIIEKVGRKYQIYLLTSSPEESALKKLRTIGINPAVFAYRICGDNCGDQSKQNGSAFKYAVERTKIPAVNHVYVGNSAKSDIIPAKSIGMQTIGVWSNIPEADVSIIHIHGLEAILL